MKVLLLDDDTSIRKLLSDFLSDLNFEVVTAHHGQNGLDTFNSDPEAFGLIISDIMMPVLDGLEFITQLRKSGATVPVILMTGSYGLEMLSDFDSLNIQTVLQKPFSLRLLKEEVEKIGLLSETVRQV